MRLTTHALAFLSLCTLLNSSADAATFAVDRTDDDPAATACTAADNDCSLRGAVLAANAAAGADTIVLPAGTYTLSVAGTREDACATGDLDITDHLTVQGAGTGVTVIDGGDIDRVWHVPTTFLTVEFTDLTIQNGCGDTSPGGGGLMADRAMLTMTDVEMTSNEAHNDTSIGSTGNGGGMYLQYGSATLTDCTLCDNFSQEGGGAGLLASTVSSLTVDRASVCNNDGGGMSLSGSNITVTDSTFDANIATATSGGGGLLLAGAGDATVTRCEFTENRAYQGAAVYAIQSTSVNLIDCTIDGNGGTEGAYNTPQRTQWGGGIYVYGGDVTVDGCTLTDNAAVEGGGMYVNHSGAAVNMHNTTVSGNSADYLGGGMYVNTGTATLNNDTVTGNSASADSDWDGDGGGIHNQGGTITIRNSILAGNSDLVGPYSTVLADDCSGTGGITSDGYNILGNDTGCTFSSSTGDQVGTAASPVDPVLEPIAANGGATMTHALGSMSPALDAANPAIPGSGGSACESVDQRDVVRPADGDPVPGAICDIGAYESDPSSADLAVNKIDLVDPVDINSTITYTIAVSNSGPDDSTGVTVVDDLPANAVYVSATPSVGSCSYASGLHRITCDLGAMANGASASVVVEATAPAGPEVLVNTVSVGAVTPDPSTGDNTDSETTTIAVLNGPDLELVKVDGADPVAVGEPITYTFFVTNGGNAAAGGVTLVDNLPPAATYLSSSSSPTGTYVPGEHRVTFDIGSLAVSATEVATVTVAAPDAPMVLDGVAETTAVEPDMNELDNIAGESTAVQPAVVNASAVVLPRTGLNACYDGAGGPIDCAATGQDAETQAGEPWPAPRFVDNGDGTITDSLTGLMWLADANCIFTEYPAFDVDVGYFDPPGTPPDGKVFWSTSLYFVSEMNAGVYPNCAAGHTDWRVPNVVELESLVHPAEAVPADWLTARGFANVLVMGYWSSTTKLNFTNPVETNLAHFVSMSYGAISSAQKWGAQPTTMPLWPVRGDADGPAAVWRSGQTASYEAGDDGDIEAGVEWPSPRFTDNGDGTVTDNLTGLMWIGDADPAATAGVGNRTWTEALDFVADLNAGSYPAVALGGHTDWRLPNRKEMLSLLDFEGHPIRLPPGHPFSNVPTDGAGYWMSTPGNTTDHSWYVQLTSGGVSSHVRTDARRVWPVRAGSFVTTPSDDDGDGIPDNQEMGPAGDDPTFDGNGDGIPDIVQDNVASTATAAGGGYATVSSDAGTTLSGVSATPSPSPGDEPPGAFPFGFFDFTVSGVPVGDCTTVTIDLPFDASIVTYYKFGPEPGNPADHWYEFLFDGTTGAEILHEPSRTRIVLHLCDGLRGDDDLAANGVIDDIGGPGTFGAPIFSDGFENGDSDDWTVTVP